MHSILKVGPRGPSSLRHTRKRLCSTTSKLAFVPTARLPLPQHARQFSGAFRMNVGLRHGFPGRHRPSQRVYYSSRPPYNPPSTLQYDLPRLVTWSAIGACALASGYHVYAVDAATKHSNPQPYLFMRKNFHCNLENWEAGRWWTLLTPSFVHKDLIHFAVNMFVLFQFAPTVVGSFGPIGFLSVWVISGVGTCGADLYWKTVRLGRIKRPSSLNSWGEHDGKEAWGQPVKNQVEISIDQRIASSDGIGASGSIFGMLTALACAAPRLMIGFPLIPYSFPLWAGSTAYASFEVYCLLNDKLVGLGHAGHLGGMAGGVLTYFGFLRPWLRRLRVP